MVCIYNNDKTYTDEGVLHCGSFVSPHLNTEPKNPKIISPKILTQKLNISKLSVIILTNMRNRCKFYEIITLIRVKDMLFRKKAKTVKFNFYLGQKVKTTFGDVGIVEELVCNDNGRCYRVKTKYGVNLFIERELKNAG